MRIIHIKESKINYFNLSKKRSRDMGFRVVKSIKYVSKESRLLRTSWVVRVARGARVVRVAGLRRHRDDDCAPLPTT